MKYLFIPVIGPIREVELPDECHAFLDRLYELLNCSSIENVVILGGHYYMIVDECGKVSEPPKLTNIRASPLYGGFPSEYIAGDVIIGKRGLRDGEPDIVGLSDREIFDFYKFLN